jgi:uncharacterized protein YcfJ
VQRLLSQIAKASTVGAVLAAMLLAGCSGRPFTTREKGILGGGALGAGTGAIVGAAVGAPGAGAAIGGTLGALTGGVIGNELQNREITDQHLQAQVATEERQIEHQRREIQRLKQQTESE